MSSHMGPTSPRETTTTYYMMLHWGLLSRLTTEVVPQGLYTIMTSQKEANTSPMRVQHTMIIYIRISFEVTNTSTNSLAMIVLERSLGSADAYYYCMLLYTHWGCVLPLYGMSKLGLYLELQPSL